MGITGDLIQQGQTSTVRDFALERLELAENMGVRLRALLERYVFSLDDSQRQFYDNYFEKYLDLSKEKKLSDTDFDLLLTAATIYQTKGNVALLSNDTALYDVWSVMVNEEDFSENRFGFLSRSGNEFICTPRKMKSFSEARQLVSF